MIEPLISIVMPAYNAGTYIEDAIASVLAQTYRHWELIVVDDGSTDNTASVTEQAQQRDDRIVYHRQTNNGLGAARNTAFNLVKGDWIAFLDADDLWHTDKLTVQMRYIEQHNDIDVFFCRGQYLYQASNELKEYDSFIGNYDSKAMYQELINHNAIPVLSVCIKKTLLFTAGIHDTNPIIKGCEDWDQWLRCCLAGARFYGIQDRLFIYRVHEGGMSANTRGMLIAGTYVLAKNHKRDWLGTAGPQIRARLITAVPIIIKALFKAKSVQLIRSYHKLLFKITVLTGSQLPGFLLRKLGHKIYPAGQ